MGRNKKQYTNKLALPNISYRAIPCMPLTMHFLLFYIKYSVYYSTILCNPLIMRDKGVGLHNVYYRNIVWLSMTNNGVCVECGRDCVLGWGEPQRKAPPTPSVYCNYLTDKIYTKFHFSGG